MNPKIKLTRLNNEHRQRLNICILKLIEVIEAKISRN